MTRALWHSNDQDLPREPRGGLVALNQGRLTLVRSLITHVRVNRLCDAVVERQVGNRDTGIAPITDVPFLSTVLPSGKSVPILLYISNMVEIWNNVTSSDPCLHWRNRTASRRSVPWSSPAPKA
jgi:hypothetical protein